MPLITVNDIKDYVQDIVSDLCCRSCINQIQNIQSYIIQRSFDTKDGNQLMKDIAIMPDKSIVSITSNKVAPENISSIPSPRRIISNKTYRSTRRVGDISQLINDIKQQQISNDIKTTKVKIVYASPTANRSNIDKNDDRLYWPIL